MEVVFVPEHEIGHVQSQGTAQVPDGMALHYGAWEADDAEPVHSVTEKANPKHCHDAQKESLVSVVVTPGLSESPGVEEKGEPIQNDDQGHDQVPEEV